MVDDDAEALTTNTTTPTPRRNLFRQPDFAKLWTAATVSLFGTQISQIAIPVIAVLLLRASPGEVGLLTTIEFLPFILFTLPAGVWVDRLSRKRILIVGDVGRALILASIPIAFGAGVLTMAQLYVVGFGVGVLTVFFDVADQSYLPTVLERDQLIDGNSKLQISTSSAQILGAPLGGGIVALFSAPFALIIDAVSYVASALLILLIRRPERSVTGSPAAAAVSAEEVSESAAGGVSVASEAAAAALDSAALHHPASDAAESGRRSSMRTEIVEGLRYIGHHPLLRSIAATTSTANLFGNVAFAIIAVYLYRDLQLTPELVGLLGGIGGAGVLVGAMVASRLGGRFGIGPTIVGSAALGGPAALLVPLAALAPSLAVPLVGGAFFVGGFVNVVYNVNQVSLRQAITPEPMLGRMNATMRFIVWGTIPVGSLLGAAMSEVLGVLPTIWFGAALGCLAFLPVLFSPVRSLQRIPDTVQEAAAS